jgi:hypothetical protein
MRVRGARAGPSESPSTKPAEVPDPLPGGDTTLSAAAHNTPAGTPIAETAAAHNAERLLKRAAVLRSRFRQLRAAGASPTRLAEVGRAARLAQQAAAEDCGVLGRTDERLDEGSTS